MQGVDPESESCPIFCHCVIKLLSLVLGLGFGMVWGLNQVEEPDTDASKT